MPQAVTHLLVALIIANLIRDFLIKDKKKFPLHYVLIAGLGGLLPDLDLGAYLVINWFNPLFEISMHRIFLHNLIFPAVLLFFGGLTKGMKEKELGKHHLKLSYIFLFLAFGVLIHLILDVLIAGVIFPFYPFSNLAIGVNLYLFLPGQIREIFFPILDAVLLVLWLVYLEIRHKISDFI